MIFFLIIVTISQYKSYKTEFDPKISRFEDDPNQYMKNLGIFIFVYCNMLSYHQIYTTMADPTIKRMKKMARRTFGFCYVVFTIFGLFAYLSLGDKLQNVDLFPQRPALEGSKDILMKILKTSKQFLS
jgi:amino acid permease